MKDISPTQSFRIFGVLCSTFGHRFKVFNKITNHISEYKCKTCGQEVTNAFSGEIKILTHKQKKINASLSDFFKKKLQHAS